MTCVHVMMPGAYNDALHLPLSHRKQMWFTKSCPIVPVISATSTIIPGIIESLHDHEYHDADYY